MSETSELHKLLNKERTKRGLSYVRWNQGLWQGCKNHSNYMLKTKNLVHAAIAQIPSGGECICGGKGKLSAKDFVKSWMNSPGHKALILSPNINNQAVAISKGKSGTYATWWGSNQILNIPLKKLKIPNPFKYVRGRIFMPTNPFKIGLSIVLGAIGFLGMLLGAHGVYVYFNRLDLILSGEGSKLFLVINMPARLKEPVMWASARGLQSWLIPLMIFLAGLWIFNFSRIWAILSRSIEKIRP